MRYTTNEQLTRKTQKNTPASSTNKNVPDKTKTCSFLPIICYNVLGEEKGDPEVEVQAPS